MLDEQVARFARDRILLEIGEQNTRLQAEIGRIRAEMAARGVLNSGMTLQRVAQACANAARDRGQLAWQILFRFVTTTGVRYHDGLADDLKALVSEFLPPTLVDLKGYPIHEAKRLGNEKATAQLVQIVESARTVALAKIKNEIDLFTVSLNSRQAMSVEKNRRPSLQYLFTRRLHSDWCKCSCIRDANYRRLYEGTTQRRTCSS
jgi:hypothetical protein